MTLTAGQKRALRRLWRGECSNAEIAEDLGFTEAELAEAVKLLGLPERAEPEVYMPTEAEIRLECAKLRMSWRSADREQRLR